MTIPLRRIDTRAAPGQLLEGGVIKASTLASADAARSMVEQAQLEAARLLEDAHAQAEGHLQQQQAQLEQRMWQSAADYAEAVGGEWNRSLAELETGMAALVGGAVRRLAEQVPADERVRACVRQLVTQTGAPDTGVLLVAEDDHASVLALADTLPWPVQRSGEMCRGRVRLVSTHGRWECDVDGALQRLLDALGVRTNEDEEKDDARSSR